MAVGVAEGVGVGGSGSLSNALSLRSISLENYHRVKNDKIVKR